MGYISKPCKAWITSSPGAQNANEVNINISSEPVPQIIWFELSWNFFAIANYKDSEVNSGYLDNSEEVFLYDSKALGLGPKELSFDESLIIFSLPKIFDVPPLYSLISLIPLLGNKLCFLLSCKFAEELKISLHNLIMLSIG